MFGNCGGRTVEQSARQDQRRFVVPGRDPNTFSVGLGTFLEYGHGGPVKMLELLAATPLNTVDATFHVPAALVFAL